MAHVERNGTRKTRDQLAKRRVPELGYYFIVTDTEETEQNYMYGLRDSIPKELQGKLVIKVIKTKSNNLVDEARNLASINPQYGEIWIIFDRDKVKNFDEIIRQAEDKGINVGWTNPCIEEWFNAYFGAMPTYQDSVACCNGFAQTFKRVTGQKYAKSDKDIYPLGVVVAEDVTEDNSFDLFTLHSVCRYLIQLFLCKRQTSRTSPSEV